MKLSRKKLTCLIVLLVLCGIGSGVWFGVIRPKLQAKRAEAAKKAQDAEDMDRTYKVRRDDLVIGLQKWNLQKVGCNHCTGLITAQKFVDAGYPVVKGTARFRSKTTNYLGNGDTLTFPS